MNKVKIIIVISIISILILGIKYLNLENNKKPYILFGNQKIYVEIARTPQEREKGLSGRRSLNSGRGMLFIFDKPGRHTFWMKDMKFNLDFIYINAETVVDTVENVPYPKNGEQPQIIVAKQNFDKVLEINAGLIQKFKIKVGDKIEY